MCSYALPLQNFCYKLSSNPRCEEDALSETLTTLSSLWAEYGGIAKSFVLGALSSGIPTGIALYKVISERNSLIHKTHSEALELAGECRKNSHKFKSEIDRVLDKLTGQYGYAIFGRDTHLTYFMRVRRDIVKPYVDGANELLKELSESSDISLAHARRMKTKAFVLKNTSEVNLEGLSERLAEVGKFM